MHTIEFDSDTERELDRVAEQEGKETDQVIREAVLAYLNRLQGAGEAEAAAKKSRALATLAKYRGRFKAEPFNRKECYDRKGRPGPAIT